MTGFWFFTSIPASAAKGEWQKLRRISLSLFSRPLAVFEKIYSSSAHLYLDSIIEFHLTLPNSSAGGNSFLNARHSVPRFFAL